MEHLRKHRDSIVYLWLAVLSACAAWLLVTQHEHDQGDARIVEDASE